MRPRPVPPHTPGFRCGPQITDATTREELILDHRLSPESADELLAFRDRIFAAHAIKLSTTDTPESDT